MRPLLWAGFAAILTAAPAQAGPIERACLQSARSSANGAVCACIQQVADQTLRGQDQRKAAKLITNPDAAHEVWLSKRPGDDAFWERYKNFGGTAEAYCAA